MKFLIQRVTSASVKVNGETVGSISKGFLVFVGIGHEDTKETADRYVKKLVGLRIFEDENGKTNLSIRDVGGELLIVSQFTLYADCSHGNRPGFTLAGAPDVAERLYEYVIAGCAREIATVRHGEFGADMQVQLINDGPFTILLDSAEVVRK